MRTLLQAHTCTHACYTHTISASPCWEAPALCLPMARCACLDPNVSQNLADSCPSLHSEKTGKCGGVSRERQTPPPNYRMSILKDTGEELPSRSRCLKARHPDPLEFLAMSPNVEASVRKILWNQLPHQNNLFENRDNLMTCWGFVKSKSASRQPVCRAQT